jgi:hypothetical protein
MDDIAVDRHELLERLAALRAHIHQDIAGAALMVEPTKACARQVSGLLDCLNNLGDLLSR